jgi:hypothetical protein
MTMFSGRNSGDRPGQIRQKGRSLPLDISRTSGTIRGYEPIERPRLLDAAAIDGLFAKPAGWFARDRVRKALYARGFPQPVIRGRWLRSAVDTWLEREGAQRTRPA